MMIMPVIGPMRAAEDARQKGSRGAARGKASRSPRNGLPAPVREVTGLVPDRNQGQPCERSTQNALGCVSPRYPSSFITSAPITSNEHASRETGHAPSTDPALSTR